MSSQHENTHLFYYYFFKKKPLWGNAAVTQTRDVGSQKRPRENVAGPHSEVGDSSNQEFSPYSSARAGGSGTWQAP